MRDDLDDCAQPFIDEAIRGAEFGEQAHLHANMHRQDSMQVASIVNIHIKKDFPNDALLFLSATVKGAPVARQFVASL